MKTSNEANDIVRQALFLGNEMEALREIDRELWYSLAGVLERELRISGNWVCGDGAEDNRLGERNMWFAPYNWYSPGERGRLPRFELCCWGNSGEQSWLLSAARQEGRYLAFVLKGTENLPRSQHFLHDLERILEEQAGELAGVELRIAPDNWRDGRRLIIPLAEIPLEVLAEAFPRWEEVLMAPLHEAVVLASRVKDAVSPLIAFLRAESGPFAPRRRSGRRP